MLKVERSFSENVKFLFLKGKNKIKGKRIESAGKREKVMETTLPQAEINYSAAVKLRKICGRRHLQ